LIPAEQPVILADGTAMIGIPKARSPQGAVSEALTSFQTNNVGLDEEKTTARSFPGRSIGITEGTHETS
jgi:hypothetical protein